MSQINVTTIRNRTGGPPSLDQGVVVGSAATFSSTVSIAGTLTYEDVTNIDSVGIITAQSYVSIADSIVHTGDINTSLRFPGADTFSVETGGSEAFRVDSSQRIVIGATSQRIVWGSQQKLSIEGTDGASSSAHIVRNSNDAYYPYLALGKSRGTSDGSSTIVQANDITGIISFNGADGGDMNPQTAYIQSAVDGTPGTNDMPGRLSFYTTPDGAYNSTERLRITSDGTIYAGATSIDWANAASTGIELNPAAATNWIGIKNASTATAGNNAFQINHGTTTTSYICNDGRSHFAGKATFNAETGLQSKYITINKTANDGGEIDDPNNIIELYCQSDGGTNRGLKIGSISATTGQWGNQWVYDAIHPNGAHYFNIEEKMRFAVYKDRTSFLSGTAWDEVATIDDEGNAQFDGSVKIGGTAAANEIDEYEEGTFTPTASNFTVSGTTTMSGQYVKVGRQVTVGIKFINTGTIAHSASAFISLPFAMAYGTEANGLIGMLKNSNGATFNSNQAGTQCKLDGEGGSRFFVGSFTTTSSGEQLMFGGTYIAAS